MRAAPSTPMSYVEGWRLACLRQQFVSLPCRQERGVRLVTAMNAKLGIGASASPTRGTSIESWTASPANRCTLEPRRLELRDKGCERERVGERETADLPCSHLRGGEMPASDCALEASVCRALRSHRDEPLGRGRVASIARRLLR